MALPTKEDISSAIEIPEAIKSTELEGYVPVPGVIGPESYSGGFCIVFPFVKGRDKKAVRVWHQEIDNIQERYKILSRDTKHCKIKSLIDIEYVEDGLTVDASVIDLTLMEWIEGKPLKNYISSIIASNRPNTDKQNVIKSLADELEGVFKKMHAKGFSHGDIQHDNIIITNSGNPRFIDYDCFYTPSMGSSFMQTTSGYEGYQHPTRFTRQYVSNEKTDYFSELILVLSIRAIANDFFLWKISDGLDYALILTPEDFRDLQASPTCKKIRAAGDIKCNQLLDILADYLKKDSIDELEPYDVLLDRINITFEVSANLIKKGSKAVIKWKVGDCKEVSITEGNKTLSSGKKNGSLTVSPTDTTEYSLNLSYDSGATTTRSLSIEVYPESQGVFTCDKEYVFPGIPFVLKWSVDNAVKVELNGQKVNPVDSKVYTKGVDKETTFVLKITDHFGSKKLQTKVKMLPMPIIKEILVPTPNINVTLNVRTSFPSFINSKLGAFDINDDGIYHSTCVEDPQSKGIIKGYPSFIKPLSKVTRGIYRFFGKFSNH